MAKLSSPSTAAPSASVCAHASVTRQASGTRQVTDNRKNVVNAVRPAMHSVHGWRNFTNRVPSNEGVRVGCCAGQSHDAWRVNEHGM